MLLLIYTEQDVFPELKVISIHLMFLLIPSPSPEWVTYDNISIHLMFLLIYAVPSAKSVRRHISIHLIFLLITTTLYVSLSISIFQYISCFYLSISEWSRDNQNAISIHLMFLLISLCTRFMFMSIMISIHLMFLLISNHVPDTTLLHSFQYISCFY